LARLDDRSVASEVRRAIVDYLSSPRARSIHGADISVLSRVVAARKELAVGAMDEAAMILADLETDLVHATAAPAARGES
jgi:hypothetical protein